MSPLHAWKLFYYQNRPSLLRYLDSKTNLSKGQMNWMERCRNKITRLYMYMCTSYFPQFFLSLPLHELRSSFKAAKTFCTSYCSPLHHPRYIYSTYPHGAAPESPDAPVSDPTHDIDDRLAQMEDLIFEISLHLGGRPTRATTDPYSIVIKNRRYEMFLALSTTCLQDRTPSLRPECLIWKCDIAVTGVVNQSNVRSTSRNYCLILAL
jgi:hypothetical protein